MYTAKIIKKERIGGTIRFTIEFSDGSVTFNETCVPQSVEAFQSWIRSRLETFNNASLIDKDETLKAGSKVELASVAKVEPATPPSLEEVEKRDWYERVNKLYRIHTYLIATGVFSGEEDDIRELKSSIKADFRTSYLDEI